MKKLLLAGLALAIMIGCTNQRYTQNSPEIDVVKSVLEAYDSKNWEAIPEHYNDTASIFFNTKTDAIKPQDIAAYHNQNDANFSARGFSDDSEFEMVKTDDGNTWVNFWGTWKGTLAANGQELTVPVHLTARFVDGKIVEEHGLWDNAPMVLAMQEIEKARQQAPDYVSNLEIVQGCYDNFASGQIPDFLAMLDADVAWHEAENFIYYKEGGYKGVDEFVTNVLERIGAEWEYWKIVDLQLHDMANDKVLATARYNAKHKATGKILDSQVAHLWTLKGGKIMSFQQYTDTKQVNDVVRE